MGELLMLWYVAFIAVLNLGLGYLWGAYVRRCPRCAKARAMGLSLLPPSSVTMEAGPRMMPAEVTMETPPTRPTIKLERMPAPIEEEVTSVEPPTPPAPPVPLDPATGLVTREHAEQMLAELAADAANQAPITVALVELARIDWIGEQPDSVIDKRVLCGVSNIVRQSLGDDHTLARFSEQQFLLLVPHEDLQQATRRAEQLRQRVATTEFIAHRRGYQTTVTCALAEVAEDRTGPKLFEFLQEALDEAKRYGGNRTFMHDGRSPTPVVPSELTVAPPQSAI